MLSKCLVPLFEGETGGFDFGDWRNWLARTVRDREAAGSNPVSPTKRTICSANLRFRNVFRPFVEITFQRNTDFIILSVSNVNLRSKFYVVPIVQWIERPPPKRQIQVRFPVGTLKTSLSPHLFNSTLQILRMF